jgi:hypothetical protein
MSEVLRRYLRVYGPVRIKNFQFWWEMHNTLAKKAFSSIADEIEEVDVEGWRAIALRATIPSMQAIEPIRVISLLLCLIHNRTTAVLKQRFSG